MKIHATTQGAGATLEEALMSQMRLSYGDARKLALLGRSSSSSSSSNKSTTASDSSLEQLVQHCQELYNQGALEEPKKPPDEEEKPAGPKVIVIHKKLKYKKPPKKVSELRKSYHKDDENKNEKAAAAAAAATTTAAATATVTATKEQQEQMATNNTTSAIANSATADKATELTPVVDSSLSSGTKDITPATTNKAVEVEQTTIPASDEIVRTKEETKKDKPPLTSTTPTNDEATDEATALVEENVPTVQACNEDEHSTSMEINASQEQENEGTTTSPNNVDTDAGMDENERAMAEAAAAVAAAMLEDGPEQDEEEQVVEQDGASPMEEACQETTAVVDETSNENDLAETEQNTSKTDNAQEPESNELVDETVDKTVNSNEENERAMAEAAAAVAAAMLQDGPDDEDECDEIEETASNDSSADTQDGELKTTTTTTAAAAAAAKGDLSVQDQPSDKCDGVERSPGTEKDADIAAGNEAMEESNKEASSLSEPVVEVKEVGMEAVDKSKTQEDAEEQRGSVDPKDMTGNDTTEDDTPRDETDKIENETAGGDAETVPPSTDSQVLDPVEENNKPAIEKPTIASATAAVNDNIEESILTETPTEQMQEPNSIYPTDGSSHSQAEMTTPNVTAAEQDGANEAESKRREQLEREIKEMEAAIAAAAQKSNATPGGPKRTVIKRRIVKRASSCLSLSQHTSSNHSVVEDKGVPSSDKTTEAATTAPPAEADGDVTPIETPATSNKDGMDETTSPQKVAACETKDSAADDAPVAETEPLTATKLVNGTNVTANGSSVDTEPCSAVRGVANESVGTPTVNETDTSTGAEGPRIASAPKVITDSKPVLGGHADEAGTENGTGAEEKSLEASKALDTKVLVVNVAETRESAEEKSDVELSPDPSPQAAETKAIVDEAVDLSERDEPSTHNPQKEQPIGLKDKPNIPASPRKTRRVVRRKTQQEIKDPPGYTPKAYRDESLRVKRSPSFPVPSLAS